MAPIYFDPDGDVRFTLFKSSNPVRSSNTFGSSTPTKSEANAKDEIEMVVSSKHMMLASPVFKAMLQPRFAEGTALRTGGFAAIPLPDDNPDAFEILLNIIHPRTFLVPKSPNNVTLTNIAILIDKYDLHQTVKFFSDIWTAKLESDNFRPADFLRYFSSSSMLCVSWVFKLPICFREVTKYLERESSASDNSFEHLPIPKRVLDAIRSCREKALLEVESDVMHMVDMYKKQRQCLQPNCDELALGTLIKQVPDPWPPIESSNFAQIAKPIRSLFIPSFCQIRGLALAKRPNCGGTNKDFRNRVDTIEASLAGLDLKDFAPKPSPAEEVKIKAAPSTVLPINMAYDNVYYDDNVDYVDYVDDDL